MSIRAINALLERRVKELEADATRLDFMAEYGAWIAWGRDRESCRVFHHDDEHDGMPVVGWVSAAWHKDPRAAIDAAMVFVGYRPAAQSAAAVQLDAKEDQS